MVLNQLFKTRKRTGFTFLAISAMASLAYIASLISRPPPPLPPPLTPTGTPPPQEDLSLNPYPTLPVSLNPTDNLGVSALMYDKKSVYFIKNTALYKLSPSELTYDFGTIVQPQVYPYSNFLFAANYSQLNIVNPATWHANRQNLSPGSAVSPDTQTTAKISNSSLVFSGKIKKTIQLASSPAKIIWSVLGDYVAAYDSSVLYLINPQTGNITSHEFSSIIQAEISPDSRYISIIYRNGLDISSVPALKTIYSDRYKSSTIGSISAWSLSNKLFYINKYSVGNVDFIFMVNPETFKKTFLFSSYPIPSGISTKIHPVVDINNSLYFVDLKGRVWYLKTSLTPQELQDFNSSD